MIKENEMVSNTMYLQVVYFGLHIVMPLISLEMLKYPKLCRDVSFGFWLLENNLYYLYKDTDFDMFWLQYFSLISHMLEVYPEMIEQLNSEALSHIFATLDFGLHHQVSHPPPYWPQFHLAGIISRHFTLCTY